MILGEIMKKKIFLIILVIIVLVVFYDNQKVIIPNNSIRLRVIPNSNSYSDIIMKERVKKYLEDNIYFLIGDNTSIDDVRAIINDNITNIDEGINSIFDSNNYDFSYKISFGYNYFPKKIYKGVTYDEGFYESLVISIGDGNGDNFWCVLFPNYCLIDISDNLEYKSYFGELLRKYSKKRS